MTYAHLKTHDAAMAIVRRVHAECGPVDHGPLGWYCPCGIGARQKEEIPHQKDCLWLAADAMKKSGVI